MRLAAPLLATLLALAAGLPSAALAAPRAEPKVVLVVGPVGAATDRYRALADEAADAALAFTSNVVKVYSPNATWPAVRQALQGASIVVYLGHGNGWPSPYRDSLYPPSQNGFGLNPVAGGGDDAHQYFGEDRIAAEIQLASNAVVVLSHLCYASGNSEPGFLEGTLDEARQRVDNYAAGFIGAGAAAVIAEAHMGPAWYVRSLLASNRPVARIWSDAPTANGHATTFASQRSPGYVAALDPDATASGYTRSLVIRAGLRSGDLGAGSTIVPAGPIEATLVGTGLTLGTPYLHGRTVAGTKAALWIPFEIPDRSALANLTLGVRWDPVDVPDPLEPAIPAADATANGTSQPSGPAATSEAAPPAGTSTPPTATGAADATGAITLVEPEQLGSLIQPVAARIGRTRITAPVSVPALPGLYRLVATLHDGRGVAYDAATQGLLRGLLVRVTADNSARFLVTAKVTAVAGQPFHLPVSVANTGARAWGHEAVTGRRLHEAEAAQSAVLVGHWLRLLPAGDEVPTPDVGARLPAGLAAGATERVTLDTLAPATPGDYVLILDVVTPEAGSLVANGIELGVVRVTVEAAPAD